MTNKHNGTNAYNSKPYSLPRTYHGNILHEADGGVH
jgi:hypothetical protein